MKPIIVAIDAVVNVVSAATGQRPEGATWMMIERVLVGALMITVLALLAFAATSAFA